MRPLWARVFLAALAIAAGWPWVVVRVSARPLVEAVTPTDLETVDQRPLSTVAVSYDVMNVTASSVRLRIESSSCSCINAQVTPENLPPGERARIVLSTVVPELRDAEGWAILAVHGQALQYVRLGFRGRVAVAPGIYLAPRAVVARAQAPDNFVAVAFDASVVLPPQADARSALAALAVEGPGASLIAAGPWREGLRRNEWLGRVHVGLRDLSSPGEGRTVRVAIPRVLDKVAEAKVLTIP